MSLTLANIEADRRDDLALKDDRTQLSWNALDPVLNRAANALSGATPDGTRAAVFAPNAVETAIAYLAGLEAGVSTVPVSYHLTAKEVEYILEAAKASVLLVGPETLETGLAAARKLEIDTVIGWRCPPTEGLIAWEDWLDGAADSEPDASRTPKPHLHFTSGTTGQPKATRTPPQYFPRVDTIRALAESYRDRRTPSPGLAVGPLYHTGPLTMVRNVMAGTALIISEHFDAEEVLATIERHEVKGSVMVPTHFTRLLALPEESRSKYDVSSMERLAHTGAACPSDVKRAMIDWFGPVLVEAYGGTEAGSTTFITSSEWLERPGSVGRAIPPFETLIQGADGSPRGPGEEGLVFFRDTSGRGIVYEGDAEKTAAAHSAPGVFTLGEVGYLDEEGYLFITDRVSDMVVSGGVNIYPAEAEQALLRHPEVADVAVVGVPHPEMGEEVRALVVPADPATPPDPATLDRFCRDALAGLKCPRAYHFVDDLGRNAMGKINKKSLRAQHFPDTAS